MKNVKRLIAIGLSLCLAIGVCGCGDGGSKSGKKLNETGEKITLRILESDTAKKEGYFDELLKAFNDAYADQNIEAVDADMDSYSDLAQNGPYGYGPDIIYQANDILMKYAEDKHILPLNLDDYECSDKIPEAAFDAFKISVDGQTYTCGMPLNIQEPMFFYRKDMLPDNWETEWDRDGNKTPDFFENWNDLYAYSKYLRDTDDSTNHDKQYGFMASYNDLYMNGEFLFSYGAYCFGTDENGNLTSEDIGFGAGDAAKGLYGAKQFAAVMNEGAIDDTITSNRYSMLANGTYFCAVSTPDTYVLFFNDLVLNYEEEGLSEDDAKKKAEENLVMTEVPAKMPKDGDFTKDAATMNEDDFIPTVVMGGVNGYGISSYTKHKEACIAFVDFATSYEMIDLRRQYLGIAPTRSDVAEASGGVTNMIFTSLAEGRIYLMPSIKALAQVWTPMHTLLGDVAKDAFRADMGETEKYNSVSDMQDALNNVTNQIYDSIYTMAE